MMHIDKKKRISATKQDDSSALLKHIKLRKMKEILKAKMHVDRLMTINKKKSNSATKQDDCSALLKHISLRKMKEIHLVKRLADSIQLSEEDRMQRNDIRTLKETKY